MIQIGIIGCGRILAAHLRGYRLLREAGVDNFRITALCARDPRDAHSYLSPSDEFPQRKPVSTLPGDPLAVAAEYLSVFQPDTDVKVIDHYNDLIDHPSVDAVNDFSTHQLHHPIALRCALKGKHLLTQKPLAVQVSQAQEMVRVFQAASLVLGVCENWRFRPLTRHAKWAIDDGAIGKLQQLHFMNVGNWWAPRQVVAHTPWRHQQAQGGGISLDIGPHLFHWVRHLGGPVTNVTGKAICLEPKRRLPLLTTEPESEAMIDCDADDTFTASFQTEQDVIGSLSASWAGAGAGIAIPPQVIGSSGSICGDQFTNAQGATQPLDDLYRTSCPRERKEREFPLGLEDGFALLQLDWLKALQEGAQPEVNGMEGLLDLACASAVLESNRQGKTVSIDELLNH